MGSFDSSRPNILKPAQCSLALIASGINRLFLFAFLLFFFVFCPSFSQLVFAAPSSPEAKNVQNPNVTFEKGLLSVRAEDVKLKALMKGTGKDFARPELRDPKDGMRSVTRRPINEP